MNNIKKFTQKDRYGNMMSFEFDVPPMESIPHPGMPVGTDTVPAWLTPGERVMNAEAERMYGPTLKAMNDQGRALQRAQGGTIPEYAASGCKVKYAADGMKITQGEGFIPFDQLPGFEKIKQQEGFKQQAYPDPIKGEAAMTVGYGHKLLPEELGREFTKEELEQMYLQDFLRSQQAARENIPGYDMMVPEMQSAFTSQAFQLGKAGQADFDDMIAAIDAGDKGKAIQEVYNSTWASQTPERAEYLADAIRKGSFEQAKSAVEGEMLASQQEPDSMIPKGYLNTDIFDEGGKFAPSAIPPLPQSGPIKPETTMERRARVMKNADEEFAAAQKIRQGTYRDPSVEGGRGNVVEQAGERADALRSTSVDPYMMEEIPPVVEKEQSFFDWLTTPQDKTLGKQLDEKLGIDFGNDGVPNEGAPERISFLAPLVDNVGKTEYTEENKVKLPEIGTVKPEMSEALSEQEKAMAARAEGTQPTYGLDVGIETYAEDDAIMEEKGAPPIPRDIAGQQGVIDKTAEQVEDQTTIDEFRKRNPYSDKTDEEILEVDKTPPNAKEKTVTSITEQTKGEKSPSDDNVDTNAVVNKGEQAPPQAKSKAEDFFKEWGLSDLFDKKEIGRMVALYLGSRALGYSHGGSLNFAAKNYAERVQQKATTEAASQAKRAEKVVQMVADGKISPKAAEMYKRTGNLAYLDSTLQGGTPQGDFEEFFSPTGKKIRAQKFKMPDGSIVFKTKDGLEIDETYNQDRSRQKGTDEYQARYDKSVQNSKELFEERFELMGGKEEDASEWTKNLRVGPKKASEEFWAFAEENNLIPDSPEARSIMGQAYEQALADAKDGKLKVPSLKPYLEAQLWRESCSLERF